MYLNDSISKIKTDWRNIISKYNFDEINSFLDKEKMIYQNEIKIFPPKNLIFECFNYFNIKDLKVVILGQDPYINEGEAVGLSFSVNSGTKIPPSLRNILKEVNRSFNYKINERENGNLKKWAKQGVLLLNTALTVRQYKSNSHKKIWLKFTNFIIEYISNNCNNVVFLLWGNNATNKKQYIDCDKHLVLSSGHPSPLNRKKDFYNNNHFIKCNDYLEENKQKIINWDISLKE